VGVTAGEHIPEVLVTVERKGLPPGVAALAALAALAAVSALLLPGRRG
jgi:hypothetical protein